MTHRSGHQCSAARCALGYGDGTRGRNRRLRPFPQPTSIDGLLSLGACLRGARTLSLRQPVGDQASDSRAAGMVRTQHLNQARGAKGVCYWTGIAPNEEHHLALWAVMPDCRSKDDCDKLVRFQKRRGGNVRAAASNLWLSKAPSSPGDPASELKEVLATATLSVDGVLAGCGPPRDPPELRTGAVRRIPV